MKILVVIMAVVLAAFIVIASRGCEPRRDAVAENPPRTEANLPRASPDGPSFSVRVKIPRVNRPLFGLLEDAGLRLKKDPEFDATSPGASAGWFSPRRLELRAEQWDLTVVTGALGEIAPATNLVYPMERGRPLIRCRPADRAEGHLRIATPLEAHAVDGEFLVKLSKCENAASGKPIDYPGRPLTVVGRFEEVPRL